MLSLDRSDIGPMLFNRLYRAKEQPAATVVLENARYVVRIEREAFPVRISSAVDRSLAGAHGAVAYRLGDYVFMTDAEVAQDAADRAAAQAAAEQAAEEQRAERERLRIERVNKNREFNATLAMPVKWRPVHRIVLSGLFERSGGSGDRRNTVTHVCLEEPITIGRLARDAGDLLCSRNLGSFGISDGSAECRVDCRACLKILARWKRS